VRESDLIYSLNEGCCMAKRQLCCLRVDARRLQTENGVDPAGRFWRLLSLATFDNVPTYNVCCQCHWHAVASVNSLNTRRGSYELRAMCALNAFGPVHPYQAPHFTPLTCYTQ